MCTTSFLQRGLNLPAVVFFYRRSWRDTFNPVFTVQDDRAFDLEPYRVTFDLVFHQPSMTICCSGRPLITAM
jgi:hypothetical protein